MGIGTLNEEKRREIILKRGCHYRNCDTHILFEVSMLIIATEVLKETVTVTYISGTICTYFEFDSSY